MSLLLLLLLLLLSLSSIQECDGRLMNLRASSSSKVVEKIQLSTGELIDGDHPSENRGSTTREKPEEKTKKTASGTRVLMPSPHAALPQPNELRVLAEKREKQERSLLKHEPGEETLEPGKTVIVDDSFSMDYQGPQRGPSIHNR